MKPIAWGNCNQGYVDASDLGLPPGVWPETMVQPDPNGVFITYTLEPHGRRFEHSHGMVTYTGAEGRVTLNVYDRSTR